MIRFRLSWTMHGGISYYVYWAVLYIEKREIDLNNIL